MKRNSEILTSNMSDTLKAFQKQYPDITSADMQSFLLGYQAAIDMFIKIELSASADTGNAQWDKDLDEAIKERNLEDNPNRFNDPYPGLRIEDTGIDMYLPGGQNYPH